MLETFSRCCSIIPTSMIADCSLFNLGLHASCARVLTTTSGQHLNSLDASGKAISPENPDLGLKMLWPLPTTGLFSLNDYEV